MAIKEEKGSNIIELNMLTKVKNLSLDLHKLSSENIKALHDLQSLEELKIITKKKIDFLKNSIWFIGPSLRRIDINSSFTLREIIILSQNQKPTELIFKCKSFKRSGYKDIYDNDINFQDIIAPHEFVHSNSLNVKLLSRNFI